MQSKFVVVKELKMGQTKNKSEYPYILDQDNCRWNLFAPLPKVELNKSYLFRFEIEGEYSNVKSIEPLVNIFHQKALQEVSTRAEVIRQFSMAFSYAKDLVIAKEVPIVDIFDYADKIYEQFNKKADEVLKGIGETK